MGCVGMEYLGERAMRLYARPPLPTDDSTCIASLLRAMSGKVDFGGDRELGSHPEVTKLRQLFSQVPASADGWEKSWEKGVTPWDLGQPTPVVLHLLETGKLPKGRIMVPGCGSGYDVVAMASPDRHVLGLDISSTAVKKANEVRPAEKPAPAVNLSSFITYPVLIVLFVVYALTEWSSSLPNANYFNFLAADFFTWQPMELFDMVFEYTFFPAIDPCMRPSWAKKIADILKPDGELITLIYLIDNPESGPPFSNSLADYEEVLKPMGFTALSIQDNDLAVGPRRGKEKLGRWKRCSNNSSL